MLYQYNPIAYNKPASSPNIQSANVHLFSSIL